MSNLSEEQRQALKDVRDRIHHYILTEAQIFYEMHPKLRLKCGIQIDANINGKQDIYRQTISPEDVARINLPPMEKPVKQINKPDMIPANTLPTLSTSELVDIHARRRKHLDDIWGVLAFRMIILEKAEIENENLIRLVKECAKALSIPANQAEIVPEMLESLLAQINTAIGAHEDMYGTAEEEIK